MRDKSTSLRTSPEAIFQTGIPSLSSRSIASNEKGELRNRRPFSSACFFEAGPLFGRKLHPLPIIVTAGVLFAEGDSPLLARRALGGGDVSLEFDRVGAGVGGRIDEGVGDVEAPVMRLRHLGDDQGRVASAEWASIYEKFRHRIRKSAPA